MSWAGFPAEYRPSLWRLFLDYEPVNSRVREATLEHKRKDYFECVSRVFGESQKPFWTAVQRETECQILRDLPRTHLVLLRSERVHLLFMRVLFVWSVRHPASGYVQGMTDMLQPFFFVFLLPHCANKSFEHVLSLSNLDWLEEDHIKEIEADSFWCFSKLLDGVQDLYTRGQPGLLHMLQSLSKVIERVSPELSQWITSEGIDYQEFAFRWVNCLLVREFSIELVFRLWDSYLSDHLKIASTHVYVCAALLTKLAPRLTGLSHGDFITELQGLAPESWSMEDLEEILAQAYVYEELFADAPSHLRSSSAPLLSIT
jgi:hypothetical protein